MTAHCQQFRTGTVTDYVEGALTAAEVDALEFHLLTCASCANLLYRYWQVVSSLRQLGPR